MNRPAFCATVLLVIFLWLTRSALQTQAVELRCQCIHLISKKVSLKLIASINLTSEGPHCAVPEVIATRKDGKQVCLDPKAPWVKKIVRLMLNQQHQQAVAETEDTDV